jgi:hypothetical protein
MDQHQFQRGSECGDASVALRTTEVLPATYHITLLDVVMDRTGGFVQEPEAICPASVSR